MTCSVLLRLAAFAAAAGLASIATAQPANDTCATATTVAAGSTTTGTSAGATSELPNTSCAFTPTDNLDVWFSFTPGVTAQYLIDTNGSTSLDDTTLAIYDTCNGAELFCDDDSGFATLSSLSVTLTGGTNYKIRIAGWDGGFGAYSLNISAPIVAGGADLCSAATPVTAGTTYLGDSSLATSDILSASCAFEPTDSIDVWFSITPSVSGFYRMTTNGSTGLEDTTLAVFTACGGTEIACDDDSGADFLSDLTVQLNAGTNYRIRVAGFDGTVGQFLLNLAAPVIASTPDNDNCAAATVVTAPSSTASTSLGATSELPFSSCALEPTDDLDVWFSFTPATSGAYRFDTLDSTGLTDTTLAVYAGCGGAEVGCNDDDGLDLLSVLQVGLTGGTNYRIRVAGFDHSIGSFVLNVTQLPPPPANDTCEAATVVSGTLSGDIDTADALTEIGSPGSCNAVDATGIHNSIWFTFTPSASGTLAGSVDSAIAGYDIMGVLFSGSCGSLTEIGCWDSEPFDLSAPDGAGNAALTAGTQYWLAIGDWGLSPGGGDTQFTITVPGGAANGACCSGTTCSASTSGACIGANTSYAGDGTVCNAFGVNNTMPCCLADFNHAGGVTVQDIFDFLAAYFSGNAQADINGGGTSVQDIFDFLSAYFTGCV